MIGRTFSKTRKLNDCKNFLFYSICRVIYPAFHRPVIYPIFHRPVIYPVLIRPVVYPVFHRPVTYPMFPKPNILCMQIFADLSCLVFRRPVTYHVFHRPVTYPILNYEADDKVVIVDSFLWSLCRFDTSIYGSVSATTPSTPSQQCPTSEHCSIYCWSGVKYTTCTIT